jgi:hypothetical protein
MKYVSSQQPGSSKKHHKSVKDLMDKNSPKVSDQAASQAVRSLLQTSMSKGKVKAIKLKVKMK